VFKDFGFEEQRTKQLKTMN